MSTLRLTSATSARAMSAQSSTAAASQLDFLPLPSKQIINLNYFLITEGVSENRYEQLTGLLQEFGAEW